MTYLIYLVRVHGVEDDPDVAGGETPPIKFDHSLRIARRIVFLFHKKMKSLWQGIVVLKQTCLTLLGAVSPK